MLKPKPVVLVQNELPDFRYILNKRKKSVQDFIETNKIKTIKELNSWILANSHEYSFSESFITEAASFLSVKSEVTVINAPQVEDTVSEELVTETSISNSYEEHEEIESTEELVAIPVKEKNHKKKNKSSQTV